jgi:hypothetical protein
VRAPGVGLPGSPEQLIDSSFYGLYTDPSKPSRDR